MPRKRKKIRFDRFLIGKFNYPFRIILTVLAVVILLVDYRGERELLWVIIGVSTFLLLWPHLAYYNYIRKGYRKKVERNALLIDSIAAGLVAALVEFEPGPSIPILSAVLAGQLALYGMRALPKAMLSILLGALIGLATNGFELHYEEHPILQLFMLHILGIFLILFALSAFRRTHILNRMKEGLIVNRQGLEKANDKLSLARLRSDELLHNILPEMVAEELKENGKVKPRFYEDATVMFTDFMEFTILSKRMYLSDILKDLNACIGAFDLICKKNGLEKIKTIGDGYMAAGGLPVENETHAFDAVNAAMEMQAFMQAFNEKKVHEGKARWELKVGIHSGPVVAGVIGKSKFQYDIWGNTVNIASRLESSCEAGRVNISGNTYAQIQEHFNCTNRGKIEVKHGDAMDMYFVDGLKKQH